MVRVKFSLGKTINTGNYENVKIEVGVEMTCEEDEVDATYKRVRSFVNKRLEQEEKGWSI